MPHVKPDLVPSAGGASPMRRRALRAALAVALAALLYAQLGPRPSFLPLRASVDGPSPAEAAGVVVFLHGRGRTLGYAQKMVAQMRGAGLPASYAIVTVEAPYSTGFGHHWGFTAEAQDAARARLRERLREWLGDGTARHGRWIICGFSQGAGLAIDTAVEDARFGALASFSPCLSLRRGELPRRDGLRLLLAHGSRDTTCPVEESRSLARVLAAAGRPVQYVEFDGDHTVPPEVLRAFVRFATAP
jgi:phospholipase/carboxylesterase